MPPLLPSDSKTIREIPDEIIGELAVPENLPHQLSRLRGGSGMPMLFMWAGWKASVIRRCHRLPRGLCLGGDRFRDLIRVNPTKLLKPRMAPKGSGLGFFTFPVLWGWWSDCITLFDGLDLPSNRGRSFYRLDLPSTRGPKIQAIPGPSSIFWPSFILR